MHTSVVLPPEVRQSPGFLAFEFDWPQTLFRISRRFAATIILDVNRPRLSLRSNSVDSSVKLSQFTSSPSGAFSEVLAWKSVGEGWRPLQGSFRDFGFSVEWHDFTTECDFDWSPSFHPDGVEICLNVAGRGEVSAGNQQLSLVPLTAGFYCQNKSRLKGLRSGGEQHRFVTVEFSRGFLAQAIEPRESGLHPGLKKFLRGKAAVEVSEPVRLSHEHQRLAADLTHPPVSEPAQRMWYQAKALEIASSFLYPPVAKQEFFCERYKRVNHERVQRVIAVLRENLAEPPES